MICRILLISLIAFVKGTPDSDKLSDLQEKYGSWREQLSPALSTSLGIHKYNDRLESFDWHDFKTKKVRTDEFYNNLTSVNYNALSDVHKVDFDIFNDTLQTYIQGYRWSNYSALNPINFLEGPHIDLDRFPDTTPFDTVGDFENYLERLKILPNQLEEMLGRLRLGVQLDHTYNNYSMAAVPGQIENILVTDPKQFPYYKPFNETLSKKNNIDNTKKQRMRQDAETHIRTIIDKFRIMKTYITDVYMHHLRSGYGVNSWDNGNDFYRACLRWHLSLDLSPEEVHQKGRDEVQRISSLMKKIMLRNGHTGTVKQYFDKVKSNSSFFYNTGEEVLAAFQNIIYNKIQPKLTTLFKNIPNLPVAVEPNPNDGAGGQYLQGPPDGSRPGVFQVNLFRPHEMIKIDFMSLALHETNPGHHLQGSYSIVSKDLPSYRRVIMDDKYFQPPSRFPFFTAYLEISTASTAGIPRYRRNDGSYYANIPAEIPSYTAYVEGWALYSESLGEEMNLYETDNDLLGRYSSEIFRGCRLVVDTGLHYYNWTREQAIDYMLTYTAYGRGDMTVEIDRYMTWPGQACAYKIGELKIRELRNKATRELGDAFQIKDFHYVLLKNGAMPLNVLEKVVNKWINDVKSGRTGSSVAPKCDANASNTVHQPVFGTLLILVSMVLRL